MTRVKIEHNKKLLYIILLLIVILAIVVYFILNPVKDPDKCYKDKDCVKASCCHASDCTLKSKAPNCEGIFCTQECVENTLDCGQGSCKCLDGICKGVIG